MKVVSVVFFLCLSALAGSKPIMVTFGTNQGPIVPRPQSSSLPSSTNAKSLISKDPAPVSEESEDYPNPNTYKPLVPRQYRKKLYSYTPRPNLILGTPVDQKYTPSFEKFNLYKKLGRSLGMDYTGPHAFERQEYEYLDAKKSKTTLQPSVKYEKSNYYQVNNKRRQDRNEPQYVPQIGIIYSAGVRYYVPQIYYNQPQQQQQQQQQQQHQHQSHYEEDPENSVYDQSDEKHFYRSNNNDNGQ